MMTIHLAAKSELEKIHKLAPLVWWPAYESILNPDQISYMLDRMYSLEALERQKEEGCQFALISEKNKVLGFSGFQYHKHGLYSKVRIEKLYVLPDSQGKQLGSKLIDYIADYARNRSCNFLELNVNRYNKAVSFYQKKGFQIIETLDIPYGSYVLNDYIMQKDLSNP